MQTNATKRLHEFRNGSHFSRDAKRIYEKTCYSHASSVVSTVTRLSPLKVVRMPPLFIYLRQVGSSSGSTRPFFGRQVCCCSQPNLLINRKVQMSTVH
ncbi:hypothetical protein CSKR_110285 [Clonorchis sinensis]|uniref:Uncharacterized protein n=1 Tax=Clonorchis sinensis TaxID=79923 RepID=A0A3R7JTG7_CLOSI|nr:hypothetical protein CSKR_110285 [Clonorchis sinensis]